jgi:ATP synthase proteolipid subunit
MMELMQSVLLADDPTTGGTPTPASAAFFGFMGCTSALVFACFGAAYGTAKSGVGVANMGVMRPELVMRSIIPVIMAGVIGIYGLYVVFFSSKKEKNDEKGKRENTNALVSFEQDCRCDYHNER